TEPTISTHELGHDPVERCALRDRMAVRPMPAVDDVFRPHPTPHADRHRLLTHAQVHEAVDLVGTRQLADALLEDADAPHRAQELEPDVAVEPAVPAVGPCQAAAAAPSHAWVTHSARGTPGPTSPASRPCLRSGTVRPRRAPRRAPAAPRR